MVPDLNALDLAQEVVEVDGNLNSEEFFKPPLPEDGEHLATLKLGDRGLKIDRQKDPSGQRNGAAFINGHLAAQLMSNGHPGLTVFDNPTSIVMQSSGTSKLHAILDVAGFKAPSRCTLGELKDHAAVALAQSPQVKVVTQWEAQSKAESLDEAQKAGVKLGEYYTIAKGMKRFPRLLDADGQETGKFDPEILNPATGEKVRAQARIIRYARA